MISITPDTPVDDPSRDQFRRWPFAQRIAQTIISRSDPSSIIIGIYGSWGDGKTTVLNFIQHELKNHDEVVSFTFNPWRFADESKMLLGFFHSLADAVGRSEATTKEKIGDWIGKYLPTVASAFGQGDTVENLSKLLSSVELEDLKNRLNEILKAEGKRVVILIDDIDRLDKNEIQSIFRLVKLNADFVNTAYVLAFDKEMVAAALQEKYSVPGSESGHSFLEKIIQVPLDLPSIPNISLRQFCFSRVDRGLQDSGIELSQEDVQTFIRGYIDGLEIRIRTPRMATRYTNILAFSLPILKGEIYPVDLMLVEGIRLFYPRLYETIKRNSEIFLGVSFSGGGTQESEKKRVREIIDASLKDLNSDEKSAAGRLLQIIFPRLQGIYGNTFFGSEWDITWSKSRRVASKDYFSRYFSYSIPETDVSDIKLDQFLTMLMERPPEEVAIQFEDLVKTNNPDTLISKLRLRATQINSRASAALAFLIADRGKLFPNPKQIFSFQGAFSQAAMLISDLMLNISDQEERFRLAEGLTIKAEPITFAAEVVRWFRGPDENARPNSFSKEEKSSLRSLLASRIKGLSSKLDMFSEFPDDVGYLLTIWSRYGVKKEVSLYLRTLLKKKPSLVEVLLFGFIPISYPLDMGIGKKEDFERDQYNLVSELIDPAEIVSILEKLFGNQIQVQEYPYHYQGDITGLEVAQQFTCIHKIVLSETEKTVKNHDTKKNN